MVAFYHAEGHICTAWNPHVAQNAWRQYYRKCLNLYHYH